MQKMCSRIIATAQSYTFLYYAKIFDPIVLHDGLFYPSISENAWRRNEDIIFSGTWCDGPENHNERLLRALPLSFKP